VSSSFGQLEGFKLPIRKWVAMAPELDMAVRDGSPKTAAVSILMW
jgi:hypothetical protein